MVHRPFRRTARAQPVRAGRQTGRLRARIADLMPRAKSDLRAMVAIRSVHDPVHSPPSEGDRMVDFLVGAFSAAGLDDVRGYPTSDGSRAVCGGRSGPPGSPTVLLYFHHDVHPVSDQAEWDTPVWVLTERHGRWYGRGAADCKGNIAAYLTALRAVGDDLSVGVKIVGGAAEQRTGGLEAFVADHAELLAADAILVGDAGNAAVGAPSLDGRVRGLTSGPAFEAMSSAMRDAYGVDPVVRTDGASVPVCAAFTETYPLAEVIPLGVEEPLCRIHAPNESVDPSEIANIALAEALFLQRYAAEVAG